MKPEDILIKAEEAYIDAVVEERVFDIDSWSQSYRLNKKARDITHNYMAQFEHLKNGCIQSTVSMCNKVAGTCYAAGIGASLIAGSILGGLAGVAAHLSFGSDISDTVQTSMHIGALGAGVFEFYVGTIRNDLLEEKGYNAEVTEKIEVFSVNEKYVSIDFDSVEVIRPN